MCVVQQDFPVAAVGAAGQEEDVRPGGAQGADGAAVEFAGGDVHDLGTGGQGDAVGGFGADQALLADDGQPQTTAGRRAGQYFGPLTADGPGHRGDAVEDFGRGGRMLGRGQDGPVH